MTKDEKDNLSKVFKAMDKDGDGKLSFEEVKNGYAEQGTKMSDLDIHKMFDLVDSDHSGFIDYSEFVVAAISDKALTSPEKLQLAFKMFDKDNSGLISSKEIISVLGMDPNDKEAVEDVISAVDSNCDGEISFDEFTQMMEKL